MSLKFSQFPNRALALRQWLTNSILGQKQSTEPPPNLHEMPIEILVPDVPEPILVEVGPYAAESTASILTKLKGATPVTNKIGAEYIQTDTSLIDGSTNPVSGNAVFDAITAKNALATPFTPVGSIAATNVQAAIAELDEENDMSVKFSVNVKKSPFNAAGSSTETVVSGALASGSTSVTLSSASSFAVGHGINITGAGTAGAAYIGKIISLAGNLATITPATATAVGAGARFRHDDTVAIQAAIDSLEFTGGSILLPAGVYNVNGPLQNTGHDSNSKIVIPRSSYDDYAYPFRFTIEGENCPVPTSRVNKGAASLIMTDGNAGWVFDSSGINLPASDPAAIWIADCTVHWVHFKNIAFRAPENPTIGLIGGRFSGMIIENMTIDVGRQTSAGYFAGNPFPRPTNDTTAVKTPPNSNAAQAIIRNFFCYGYGNAIYAQEHTDMANIYISKCINGIKLHSPSHGIYGSRIQIEHSTNALYAAGPVTAVKIDALGVENVFGVTVYDPTNLLNGSINHASQSAYFSKNGANKVDFLDLKYPNFSDKNYGRTKISANTYSQLTLDTHDGWPITNLLYQSAGSNRMDLTWNETSQTASLQVNQGTFSFGVGPYQFFKTDNTDGIQFTVGLSASVGYTLKVKAGVNCLSGTVTLAAGAGTITSTAIDTNTIIMLSLVTSSGTVGLFAPLTKVNAGSANVTGAGTDNSTYNWIALKKY